MLCLVGQATQTEGLTLICTATTFCDEQQCCRYLAPCLETMLLLATVVQILVEHGSDVRVGDDLVIIEAMKMRNAVKASRSGIVHEILAKKGDIVTADQPLIKFW